MNGNANDEATDDLDSSFIKNHVSGGLPMISDSMFSLVILIYVSAAFCFVFFMFCWNNESGGGRDTGIKDQCILMANNIAKRGGGVDDLPAEAEVIAASATTVGAAAALASVTLKRATSMSTEAPLLTTDDDGENDEPRRESKDLYTNMPRVMSKTALAVTVAKEIVVSRTDNCQATTVVVSAVREDGERINIESERQY